MENRIQIVYQKYIQNNRTEHINENIGITKNIERGIEYMGTKANGIKVTYRKHCEVSERCTGKSVQSKELHS